MRKITILTGAESTGKTTLAKKLSIEENLPLVEEYAREYLEEKLIINPAYQYTLKDLVSIAKKQNQLESQAFEKYGQIVCDTDIITIQIWAMDKFKTWLDVSNPNIYFKEYLLCPPDIPWVSDPLRENPTDRWRIHHMYIDYLDRHGLTWRLAR